MKLEAIWQVDFHPCPLLDDQGKRVWELLVCDGSGHWQQACYASNQEVNSRWVSEKLQAYLDIAPVKPMLMRIFRLRMAALLQRAAELVGIPSRLSRRVYSLQRWYAWRQQQVYPQEGQFTYKPEGMPEPVYEDPQPLPDALRGERWALVTLRAQDFQQDWQAEFGEMLPLDWQAWDPETVIPGLLITSRRARAIAAWMSGVDPYAVSVEPGSPGELLLEVGGNLSYVVARLGDATSQREAAGFAQRLQAAGGIHFLAVQETLKSQQLTGFWLLAKLPLEG
ncbi:MAG: Tab2/Atab2 family RNA-binding protein [Thermostichales cyanobacterium HHBFW_bins_127]